VVVYTGAMPSAHVSGLRDGAYRFRVRIQGEQSWSEPATLEVSHHPMTLVWPLLSLGAALVFAIAAYCLRHARGRRGAG